MSDLSKQGGGRKPFSRGGKRGKKERKKKKPTLLWHLRGVGPGSINRPSQRTRAVAGQKEVTATSRHSFFSFFLPAPRPPFLLSTRPIFAKIHGALHEKRALAAKQGQRGGREAGGESRREEEEEEGYVWERSWYLTTPREMEKRSFVEKCARPPSCNHLSHSSRPPPPLPPGPTRNSRENRVHVSTRARLRTYLVSPVRITAHSYASPYALHPPLPFYLFSFSPLPSSPRVYIYIYIYFFILPPFSNISLAPHNGPDFKKRIFWIYVASTLCTACIHIYILHARDVSRNNNYPLHWKNCGDLRGRVKQAIEIPPLSLSPFSFRRRGGTNHVSTCFRAWI